MLLQMTLKLKNTPADQQGAQEHLSEPLQKTSSTYVCIYTFLQLRT